MQLVKAGQHQRHRSSASRAYADRSGVAAVIHRWQCSECRLSVPWPVAAPVRCSCGHVDNDPQPCRINRERFRTRKQQCQCCEHWDARCKLMGKQCSVEKFWIGEVLCPGGKTFPKGRVGFLAVAYMPIGGTEVWHQTLIPRLDSVAGFVAFEPQLAGGNLDRLPCVTEMGLEAAKQLASSCDVLVVWGIGSKLGNVLDGCDKPPRVISVSHCDSRSEWTSDMMMGQAPWTDHSVYLCPTGRETCPPGIPASHIPNAPSPERVASAMTREQARASLGIARDERLLLAVSRLSPEKQVAKLIQAVDRLPKSYRLIVAGTAGGWSSSHAATLKAIASDRVSFVGNVDPPADLLAAADAFLAA